MVPAQKQFGVLNDHVLLQSGVERLDKIDLSKVEAFSLCCENMQTSSPIKKIISRVVLVTDSGQRVLDTLVSSQDQVPAGEKVVVKDGLKTKLHLLADARGPKLQECIDVITFLIRGKKLVGYHLPMKLADVGIMSQFQQESMVKLEKNFDIVSKKFAGGPVTSSDFKNIEKNANAKKLHVSNIHDIAKIFNRDQSSQAQIPFGTLCINELNLSHQKRGYPYVYTEAKISMALYLRWKDLKDGKATSFITADDKENFNPNEKVEEDSDAVLRSIQHFQDKSQPIELGSSAMIRFLIEDHVKKEFKSVMA